MFCVKKNTVFSEVVHFHFKDRDIVTVADLHIRFTSQNT